jgi:hypothetical protein
VVWYTLENVIQSNSRFALTDRLVVHLDHIRMPVSNGRKKTKERKGRSFDVLIAIKELSLL